MKKGFRTMVLFVAFLMIALLGLVAFVRLAPTDPMVWHQPPEDFYAWDQAEPWSKVVTKTEGAILRLPLQEGILQRLDTVALATPRTMRLAGSVEEGRITWVTRSALWGFPDYTTAQVREDGLYIYARLRFGQSDLGVNGARLRDWLSKL